MTNSKQTKKALFSSVIALILCFSMLIGTTFAWFTDSVQSGLNEIRAGNLDVELYHKNSYTSGKVNEGTALFVDKNGNPILWEPGVVVWENLTIANEGTLALKYQLAVNFLNENATTDGYSLSQVLKVGVVEGGVKNTERDLVVKEVATADWANLAAFQKSGSLLPEGNEGEDEVTYGIVIWWEPSDEDNNWNLNNGRQTTDGLDYLHIDLGVTLMATQWTYEEDSFDELYDQGANATKTIDGIVYKYDGTDIILYDADGYTGEDLIVPDGVTKIGASAFVEHATIKNVVLPNSVKVIGTQAFQKAPNLESIVLNEGLVEIQEKAFNQALKLESFNIPSTVETIGTNAFRMVAVNPLVIPANVTSLAEGAFRDLTQVETIVIEGNTELANFAFRSCPVLETVVLLGDDVTFTGTSQVFTNNDSTNNGIVDVYVQNETVKQRLLDATANDASLNIVIAAAEVDGIVKAEDGTRYVYSVEGLQNLHNVLQDWTLEAPQKVTLVSDLDMNGETWVSLSKMFVNFDGNGHTISNLVCTENGNQSGFFGYLGGGWIKNLTLENVTSIGSQAGIFAGQSEGGNIINCTIAGSNLVAWDDASTDSTTGNGVGVFVGVSVSYGSANEISGTIAEGAVVTLLDSPYAWETTDPYYGGFFTADYETLVPVVNVTNSGTVTSAVQVAPGVLETGDRAYQITSKEGLMNLYSVVSANPGEGRGDTITLMADIDMAGEIWTPVDTMWMTIDGNGHTISNLTCAADVHGQSGLFPYAGHVTIKNLTLHNVTATGSQAGAFFANAEGCVMENCKLSGNVSINYQETTETYNGVGALIGWSSATTMTGVEIVEGTNVTLNKGTMTTDGKFLDNYVGAGGAYTGAVINNGEIAVGVSNTEELIAAIKAAPVGEETVISLADGTYSGDINITLADMGKQAGDVVIKAAGKNAVIAGTVTLGYRNQGVGSAMWNANVTFEGITFDHAENGNHSISVQDVKSLTLKNCKIIGDGEYGIDSPRGNAAGQSTIYNCAFENAGMQVLGNFGTGLVIEKCTFNNSRINVQAGNGVTVKDCTVNNTLTDANVGDSFYFIRSNATPITVTGCEINIDSTVTGVAAEQAKWGILWNRGTTNWTVTNVAVTLTDGAQAQTELLVTKSTSTGVINTENLTVNGVAQ